ncbi:MAG: hypothetical protein JWM16_3471 [Verrucomicrobiales bacterium]|nr:hypothetical protein [Verrucomicrobiales bacterium]
MTTPTASPPNFVPWDIEVARLNFGANCGPVSFAALSGTEVCRVISHFPHFEHSAWTNLTQMLRALDSARCNAEVRRREFPKRGLALIQWLGPWTRTNFFSRWSLPHTHWVAVDGDWIFDNTAEKWQTLREWGNSVAVDYITRIPRATGWAVKYGLEIKRKTEPAPCFPAQLLLGHLSPA